MSGQGSGTFISFEGGEGSGKSSQIVRLAASLRADGYEVVTTRAPGGTSIGAHVRDIVLHTTDPLGGRAETLLFLADMSHLTESVIRPALARGAVVIVDRFQDSTIAYQGHARGHGADDVARIAEWANGGLKPDLTLLLDVPVSVGLSRKSSDEWNRMEEAGLAFHESVRRGLSELSNADPSRFALVDALKPVDDVQEHVERLVRGVLRNRDHRPAAINAAAI